MLRCIILSIFSLLLISVGFGQPIPDDSLYLGQTPPGNMPKIFKLALRPGYFAAERIAISDDGKEIYYTEKTGYSPGSQSRIKYFRYCGKNWNGPFYLFDSIKSRLSFCDYLTSPGLSLDDTILYFHNSRHQSFYSVKNDSGWSEPSIFWNNSLFKHYLQATKTGNYYLTSDLKEGLGICRIRINNIDTIIQNLKLPTKADKEAIDFYISRDESFIIYSSYKNPNRACFGYADLFVSYKKSDTLWTNPKNLGPVINNTSTGRWAPYVTADNQYLFFSSGKGPSDTRINWVRIGKLIDSLKYTNFIPYVRSPIAEQHAPIGSLFSFTIPENTFIDDDDNNTLTYSATLRNGDPLPSWLHFESKTRKLSGTPINVGNIDVKVSVIDSEKTSASSTFTIQIIK